MVHCSLGTLIRAGVGQMHRPHHPVVTLSSVVYICDYLGPEWEQPAANRESNTISLACKL